QQRQQNDGVQQQGDGQAANDPAPPRPLGAITRGRWNQDLIPVAITHAIGTAMPAPSRQGAVTASSPDTIAGIAASVWAWIIAAIRAVPARSAASKAAASSCRHVPRASSASVRENPASCSARRQSAAVAKPPPGGGAAEARGSPNRST